MTNKKDFMLTEIEERCVSAFVLDDLENFAGTDIDEIAKQISDLTKSDRQAQPILNLWGEPMTAEEIAGHIVEAGKKEIARIKCENED
jgi:hypothetical protein